MAKQVRKQLAELVEAAVESSGYEFVDMEYVKEGENWVCRVFIDKAEGIGLDDCERMSGYLSNLLDEKDIIPHRYLLEVSSPGLDRPLKNERDFERFKGYPVKVKTYKSHEGRKKVKGTLIGYEDGKLIIEPFEDNISVSIPVELISSVRLIPEF